MLLRPLLILDIDETLIHGREEPLARPCEFLAGHYHIYERPHLGPFLKSVSELYDLACWSSATHDYLEIVVNTITKDLAAPLLFVWDRSRCTRRTDFTLQEEYYLKDLQKIKKKGYNLERVLILEDEPRKVNRHFGNAIFVKPYVGALNDDELPKLASYLKSIASVPNFRDIEKRNWRTLRGNN
ncbi:MAG: HAD family hydrolase [Candidatus Obscuribacterales bacterium]